MQVSTYSHDDYTNIIINKQCAIQFTLYYIIMLVVANIRTEMDNIILNIIIEYSTQ